MMENANNITTKPKVYKHSEKFDDCYYNFEPTEMRLGCSSCAHFSICEDETLTGHALMEYLTTK